MTDPGFTVIQAIIDRSGSMESIRSDAEGGFNAFIADQRTQPGECRVSLVQFDHEYEVVYEDTSIADVPRLRIAPRGRTAMLDAIGHAITSLGVRLANLPEDKRPGTVLVCIVTDGLENASREFNYDVIKTMITHQEQVYSWTFLYLGADQDAIAQGSRMGIDASRALSYGRGNSGAAYRAMSSAVSRMRTAVAAGAPAPRDAAAFTDEERSQAGGTPL